MYGNTALIGICHTLPKHKPTLRALPQARNMYYEEGATTTTLKTAQTPIDIVTIHPIKVVHLLASVSCWRWTNKRAIISVSSASSNGVITGDRI